MSEKKYYFMKLTSNFFNQKHIKKLRKIAGGDTCVIIYLKMHTKALENDGKLLYEGYEDTFEKELALDLDEEVENVEMTMDFLLTYKLIEEEEEKGEFLLCENPTLTGRENSSTQRVRAFRDRRKRLLNDPEKQVKQNETFHCNTEIELELEKEIKKELEIVKKIDRNSRYLYLSKLLYQEHIKHDPKFLHGKDHDKTFKRWSDSIRLLIERDGREWTEVERVIIWCQNDDFWKGNILSGDKLRKQFDRLILQCDKTSRGGNPQSKYNPNQGSSYSKKNGGEF